MNNRIVLTVFKSIIILIVQVLICNNIHLLSYASPLIIGYLLITCDMKEERITLLLYGFFIGLIYDMFSNTAGMAAAGMTLLAMTQPNLLTYMSPRETDDDVEPTIQTMGFWNYASYVFLAMMILHTVYYFLDAFMLANIQLTIFSSVLSALLATVLVLGIDMLTTTSKRN